MTKENEEWDAWIIHLMVVLVCIPVNMLTYVDLSIWLSQTQFNL